MTRSWDYPGRKHQVIQPPPANSPIATGKLLKPMNSKRDEQVPTLSSPEKGRPEKGRPEKPPVPDDVQTKSPLTYFQFYLDEVVQSANVTEPTEKRQSISTTALLGTGFVAATVVSGLLIGDALNQPTAPPDTKILPLKPRQRALKWVPRPRPTLAVPEKLVARRSQAIPESVSASPIVLRQNSVDQTIPQSVVPMLPSVTLAAVPETLTVSRNSTPKRIVTGTPAPAGMKPLVRPPYQELPDLQRPPQTPLTALNSPHPAAIRETIPTEIAAPERIPSGQSAATSTLANPSQPSTTTLTKPASLPPAQPSIESSPATPPRTESELAAPNPSVPAPVTPATEPPSVNSPSSEIESKLPNGAVKKAMLPDRRSAIAAAPANLSAQPGVPSHPQDVVPLAQSVAQPTTVMPLTQPGATEAER
jgi:hypothetical protein